MPLPRFSDIRRFCEIDEWEEVVGSSGRRGDHFRYRKILEDGSVLRTKASHSNEEIGDKRLWRHIWRDQLGLDSEDQFWEAIQAGKPVDRTGEPSEPSGPSLPGWLVNDLIRKVGLSPKSVAGMAEEEALETLHRFYSHPRDDS